MKKRRGGGGPTKQRASAKRPAGPKQGPARKGRRSDPEPRKRGLGRSRAAKKAEKLGDRGGGRNREETKRYVGRVQKNPKGFGFLIPEEPGLPDAYVPAGEAAGLLDGDRVEYSVQRRGERLSARVHKVISRGTKEVLGTVRFGRNGKPALVTSEGEFFQLRLDGQRIHPGDWAIGRITEYPSSENAGEVELDSELGPELLPKHDYRIAIARFGLDDYFGPAAIRDAEGGQELARRAIANLDGRRDLRDRPIVTIDGPDAKDFDDAVLVEMPSKGAAFILYVSIADVSSFVREGTALDTEARNRGTSVYMPGKCLPMLPEVLSNGLCSLRPREDKLALTAEIHFDRDGNVDDTYFYESVIKTVRRLTYDDVHEYIQGNAAKRAELKDIAGPLSCMEALYKTLRQKRKERGVLDFDLPECQLILDDKGMPVTVRPAPRFESHKYIEEMMIAANRAVAQALRESDTPSMYRVHEEPDPGKLEDLNQMLKSHGILHQIREVSPKAFSKLLEATANVKGHQTIHQAVLRTQKQARYETEPKGHFGLALRDYTHFTSPIRRYPDLVVHRSLKKLIHRGKSTDNDHDDGETLEAVAAQNSESERRAMEAERFVVKRKQCWFMLQHVGKPFDGRISGVTSRGIFVTLPEFALDGFVSIDSLGGMYEFDERRNLLRKRPGHTVLSVGDDVKIKVERVNIEENQIEFVMQ